MFWARLIYLFTLCQTQEIEQLPGVGFELNFKHYSGFFQVSDTHLLHYWFVESQNKPDKDPLIFWFSGGPGYSSLGGLLKGTGPYLSNYDGRSLRENPHSWNKMASVVYIESPAGVGYSYSTDGNITSSDDQTSLENYEAVKQFFHTFSQYRHHATYIMGSSYGGVYVPTLTTRIVDGQKDFPINLKGMAIGNGCVSEKLNLKTSIHYAYAHGIIDEQIWNILERDCCRGCIDSCDFTQAAGYCVTMVEDIFQFLWAGGEFNMYDLYRDCDSNQTINGGRKTNMLEENAAVYISSLLPKKKTGDLLSFLRAHEPPYGSVPCLNYTDVITYMNDAEVRKALNIPVDLPNWDILNNQISTTHQKQYVDMAPFIKKIVAANVRVLLYYGDTDMACNFMMGQQFADQLGLKQTLGKTPWKFDRQIAGFKTLYEGLTFITVRGAGHMAPQWKAPQMYYAIQQFLLNRPI